MIIGAAHGLDLNNIKRASAAANSAKTLAYNRDAQAIAKFESHNAVQPSVFLPTMIWNCANSIGSEEISQHATLTGQQRADFDVFTRTLPPGIPGRAELSGCE
jgi:hypothetical protein